MSLLKYLERAKRIDDLIRRKATGNADEFAARIGVSRSTLLEHLRDLKEIGAPIRFCESRQSYFYDGTFSFIITNKKEQKELVGGNNFFENILSPIPQDSTPLALSCTIGHASCFGGAADS